jgi:hypothetical protein
MQADTQQQQQHAAQQPSRAKPPTLESFIAEHPLASKIKLRPGMLWAVRQQVSCALVALPAAPDTAGHSLHPHCSANLPVVFVE